MQFLFGVASKKRIANFSGDGLAKALLKLERGINENAFSVTLIKLGQAAPRKLHTRLLSKNSKWLGKSGLKSSSSLMPIRPSKRPAATKKKQSKASTQKKGAKSYHPALVFMSELKLLYHSRFRTFRNFPTRTIVC